MIFTSLKREGEKLFDIGELFVTQGAMILFAGDAKNEEAAIEEIISVVESHQRGCWGDVNANDAARNDIALVSGARLFSVYTVNGRRVWVITEADRSSTTILLPEEY